MDAMLATEEREPELYGRIGGLIVRLAASEAEIAAVQSMRHHVFSQEFGAYGQWRMKLPALDADHFDTFCDHMVVIDTSRDGPDTERIVGTYRLLRQEQAEQRGGFYSASEFDLEPLLRRQRQRRFLELGRSCVLPAWRSKRTLELLWQGIWAYCRRHEIDVMIGCGSFPGTDPRRHAEALAFLAHHCAAEPQWQVRAHPARMQAMDFLPREAVNPRRALAAMPPLIKGYLRLGAGVGEGCVIDPDFGTVDIFIILPCERITSRYLQHYGVDATRFRAE